MSGAQAKAVVICGCIGVIAEVGSKTTALRTHLYGVNTLRTYAYMDSIGYHQEHR